MRATILQISSTVLHDPALLKHAQIGIVTSEHLLASYALSSRDHESAFLFGVGVCAGGIVSSASSEDIGATKTCLARRQIKCRIFPPSCVDTSAAFQQECPDAYLIWSHQGGLSMVGDRSTASVSSGTLTADLLDQGLHLQTTL